jgi:cobalt-zinc-cadmium efflux system outer membrane protein
MTLSPHNFDSLIDIPNAVVNQGIGLWVRMFRFNSRCVSCAILLLISLPQNGLAQQIGMTEQTTHPTNDVENRKKGWQAPPEEFAPPTQAELRFNRRLANRHLTRKTKIDSINPNAQDRDQRVLENSLIQPAESLSSNSSDSTPLPWQPQSENPLANPDNDQQATLDEFERLAIQNHPTLNPAVARILTARHEALQAGLAPNPVLGLFIDELGNENDPGLWGAYLQRKVVRGNKLALGRQIKKREANVLEIEFESQVLRIKTDVRTSFYKLLIAQKKYELVSQLYEAQQNAISKSAELFDAGETPKTDLLQTELQAQKTMIVLSQVEIAMKNAWRELTLVIGNPDMPFRTVTGSLDPIAEKITYAECLAQIIANSPEIQSANAEVIRVRATVEREVAETTPNYQTQVTLGRDSASNHFFTGVQLQVPLQVCDRNQGNIAAAKSRLTVAQQEVDRIKLNLAKRLSQEYQQYESALAKSEMFNNALLPKAQQTLDLLVTGYPEEVSFLQLITAQQTVIDITLEYLDTISQLWDSRLKIEGLLLNNSLNN